MDLNLRDALLSQGVTPASPLPAGTRKSGDVDILVGYTDYWRWDLAMYLKSIAIDIFDAKSGNLLVTARWSDSIFHGFRDSKAIVNDLVGEMISKLKTNLPK